MTSLHWAAWRNSTDVISILLQEGALTNISDNFGSTALDEARRSNNKEAVHLQEQHKLCTSKRCNRAYFDIFTLHSQGCIMSF